jgi:hypothetical protein
MSKRGTHSWGFTNGEDVHKQVGDIMDKFDHEVQGHSTALLHTRYATFGDRTADNSHPFKVGRILGVHNGMINNHKDIATKYGYEYKVDSEMIFHHLNEGRELSDLKGYGAVVFFEDGIIHLGTFNAGQLVLVKSTWGWMWASTADAVNAAFRIAGLGDTFQYQVKMKDGKMYRLQGDQIVKDRRRLSISSSSWSASDRAATSGGSSNYSYGVYSGGYKGGINPETGYDPSKRQMWDTSNRRWVERPANDDPAHPSFMDSKGAMFVWDAENKAYVVHHPPEPKQLPLPTAETTTFKPTTMSDVPSSDYDDIVESEGKDETLEDWCAECGMVFLSSDEFVVIDHAAICKSCFNTALSGDADEDADDYTFDLYSAAEVEELFGWRKQLCEDCREWMDDPGGHIYIERNEEFAVCETCYDRNYSDVVPEQDAVLNETEEAPVVATA